MRKRGMSMSSFKKQKCWEIMNCEESDNCPARQFPDTPCWEISRNLDTSHEFFKVCEECIVYILKSDKQVLTENELNEIIEYREVMRFVGKCPVFDNRA